MSKGELSEILGYESEAAMLADAERLERFEVLRVALFDGSLLPVPVWSGPVLPVVVNP